MDEAQFNRVILRMTNDMREHVFPYVTAISREVGPNEGEHLGSGVFLALRGHTYLLTNAHVACSATSTPLAVQLSTSATSIRLRNAFHACTQPLDLAVTRIEDEPWAVKENRCRSVLTKRLSEKHDPQDKEFLFFLGYSDKRSHFSPTFKTLSLHGTPHSSQVSDNSFQSYGPVCFGMSYNPQATIKMSSSGADLPDPHGFSGTPVWNTRFYECKMMGQRWTPEESRITGIAFGWDQDNSQLIAIRIEYVRAFLLEALRREAAYFHWLSRGCPQHDDLADWIWAVQTVAEL
jgi:hypothetical protein